MIVFPPERTSFVMPEHQACAFFSMPVSFRGAIDSSGNGSSALRGVTLKGDLILGGIGLQVTFCGTPKPVPAVHRDITTKLVLLPKGEVLETCDRSMRARIHGDTAAWIQWRDGDGVPLTDHIYLGRLGRGPCLMDAAFTSLVQAETCVSPAGLLSGAESDLVVAGDLTFLRGITLRVTLRRREGALWWARRPDAALEVAIIGTGHLAEFPIQPVWLQEAVGALKSLVYLDGVGDPFVAEDPSKLPPGFVPLAQ